MRSAPSTSSTRAWTFRASTAWSCSGRPSRPSSSSSSSAGVFARPRARTSLTVIDFVGNHRTFLDRVRTLLSFGEGRDSLRRFLVDGAPPELPPGCSVVVDPEAIDLLAELLPRGGSEVERAFRELRAARGERPTAGEFYRMGYRPSTLRQAHGGWFDFLESEGALSEDGAEGARSGAATGSATSRRRR